MKEITKLELLLNKVVEYNKPDETYIKAFLYKDNIKGYYLKVVEILLGSLSFNQIIYLVDGDENYIIKAEKPKLMRVSFKSWHYRLVKYVLKDSAPTPKTMQNGCPYFWLLLFSMFSVSFILLYNAVKWIFLLIPKAFMWYLEKTAIKWLSELDDITAYEYYENRRKMPKGVKMYFNREKYTSPYNSFYRQYIKNNYSDDDYLDVHNNLMKKWLNWNSDRFYKEQEKHIQLNKKCREKKEKWNKKMEPFNKSVDMVVDFVDKIIDSIKMMFTFERGKLNLIIKRTKQFVGLIITSLILAISFVIINLLVRLIMGLLIFSVANWMIFAIMGIIIATIVILYLIYLVITTLLQNVINKYKDGRKIWYIEILLYLTFYPLKYIIIVLKYIVWYPVKFILYDLLFKLILTPVGKILFKIIMTIWNGFVGSTGIFGEYFGASYSDYCPGLEWCDFEEEEEEKEEEKEDN